MSNLIPAPPTGSAASMCDSRGRPASSPATRRPRTAPPLVIARLSPPFTAAGASTPPRSGTPGSPARSAAANLHTGAVLGVAVQCSSPTYVHRLNDPPANEARRAGPKPPADVAGRARQHPLPPRRPVRATPGTHAVAVARRRAAHKTCAEMERRSSGAVRFVSGNAYA